MADLRDDVISHDVTDIGVSIFRNPCLCYWCRRARQSLIHIVLFLIPLVGRPASMFMKSARLCSGLVIHIPVCIELETFVADDQNFCGKR